MPDYLPQLTIIEDSCRVYVLRSAKDALVIDFGSGAVMDYLRREGLRLTDVLVTHHHRDQVQGIEAAVHAGARIWVPYSEKALFTEVDWHWQGRNILNNYDVRQDRFSLLRSLPKVEVLEDYQTYTLNGFNIQVIPTPGHTQGSVSLLVEVNQKRLAFTGDLIYAPGKVWSLAATQWTYNGGEGLPATAASLLDLKRRGVDVLLPSHGQRIAEPEAAIDLLVARLAELMRSRAQNPHLFSFIGHPYAAITAHLLRSQQNMANTFVLLSETGKALLIDYGYDFMTGMPESTEPWGRRPWLYSIPALKREWGVTSIDVVIPTHYHDDHVAGINLLRRVEGTQVWAAENFAHILEAPSRYDLPCLWYDPISVDRTLPLNQPFPWQEYSLTVHGLPGHTLYACAVSFYVDGVKVLATGDQYAGSDGMQWNYVYQNRFRSGDFRLSAELYASIQPQLILSGHWDPLWVSEEDFWQRLYQRGCDLERMHAELLPEETQGFGAEGFGARMLPYQATIKAGETVQYSVEIHNPFNRPAEAVVRLCTPPDWGPEPPAVRLSLAPLEMMEVELRAVVPAGISARRERLAVDLCVDGQAFGQQAEALLTIE